MPHQQVQKLFEQAGIRVTAQRVEIASVILAHHQHLSADAVLARVRERGQHVSKATVYNTLNLFTRKGLIKEVLVDPNRVFYDSNACDHHHFYLVDTGDLIDVRLEDIEFSNLPPLPNGTFTDGIEVIIRLRKEKLETMVQRGQ